MNRHDRARWRSARTLYDLGDLVVAWLHGEIAETPDHLAPPDPETIPLIPDLEVINRGGFVTDNSQAGRDDENCLCHAWVQGFASGATFELLREAAAWHGLTISACRDRDHGCGRRWWRPCPGNQVRGSWADRCPDVASEIYGAWHVTVADPIPGTNMLWPVLAGALTEVAAS